MPIVVLLTLCLASNNFNLTHQPTQAAQSTPNSDKLKSVVYTNKKYGFRFLLPESWRGYSVIVTEWEGGDGQTYQVGEVIPPPTKGPLIWIKHPLSSAENPRQGIPIMIFTKAQWRLIENDTLIVSAAPIGPTEIGRNGKYVFALPARFNYALITGWEEVDQIVQDRPLRPLTPTK